MKPDDPSARTPNKNKPMQAKLASAALFSAMFSRCSGWKLIVCGWPRTGQAHCQKSRIQRDQKYAAVRKSPTKSTVKKSALGHKHHRR